MNWKLLSVIILGSILDNIGSMGPLMAMSPLMLYEYNYDYLLEGEKPPLRNEPQVDQYHDHDR